MTDSIRTDDSPSEIAYGYGSVWVASHRAGTVERVDPNTNQVVADVRSPGRELVSIAIGAGHVWTFDAENGDVEGIDPAANRVKVIAHMHCDGGSVAATSNSSSVWFAGTSGKVSRIDAETGRVLAQRRLAPRGSGLGAYAAGSHLWVADPDHATLYTLSPTTLSVLREQKLRGDVGTLLAAFGRLWVGGFDGPLLYALDPATGEIQRSVHIPAVDHLAADHRYLYVRISDQVVRALDPRSLKTVHSYRGLPASEIPGGGILALGGSLWAVNWTDRSVWRIRR